MVCSCKSSSCTRTSEPAKLPFDVKLEPFSHLLPLQKQLLNTFLLCFLLLFTFVDLLAKKDFKCGFNDKRGYGHGVFVPIKFMYPDTDIPIVQLPINVKLESFVPSLASEESTSSYVPALYCCSLSLQVVDLLAKKDIKCGFNNKRGYDHGVFVPIKLMYSDADIPIVQLPLNVKLESFYHLLQVTSQEKTFNFATSKVIFFKFNH